MTFNTFSTKVWTLEEAYVEWNKIDFPEANLLPQESRLLVIEESRETNENQVHISKVGRFKNKYFKQKLVMLITIVSKCPKLVALCQVQLHLVDNLAIHLTFQQCF